MFGKLVLNWFQTGICTESAVALQQEYLQECTLGKVTFRTPGTQVLHIPVIWCYDISVHLSSILGCAEGIVKWLAALTGLNYSG
jgi:hypothetical protein